jgi:hypothetical protein
MKRAGEEAAKHRMGFNNPFKASWDARDPYPPLTFQPNGQPVLTMLLSDFTPILVHSINSSWSKKGPWANKDNIRCVYWGFDEEGRWVQKPGGRTCLLCKALGRDPKFGLVGIALDNQPYFNKRKNQMFQHHPKRVEIYDDAVRGMILSMVERFSVQLNRQPLPRGAVFSVMRSGKDKSPAHGDIWTFEKFEADAVIANYKDWIPNWDLLFPYHDDSILIEMLKRHKEVCDKHGLTTYNADNMAYIVGGGTPAPEAQTGQGKIFSMAPTTPAQGAPQTAASPFGNTAPSGPATAPGFAQVAPHHQAAQPAQAPPAQTAPFAQATPFAQAAPPTQATPPAQAAPMAPAPAPTAPAAPEARGTAPWETQTQQSHMAPAPFGPTSQPGPATKPGPRLDDLDDAGGDDDFDPYNQ